jgi:lipoprotein-anchoring transpeptidase ErfK/SrfK
VITDPAAVRRRFLRRPTAPVAIAGALAVVVLAGGVAALSSGHADPRVEAAAASEPVAAPVLSVVAPAGPRAAVPWQAPLTLTVTDGTLEDVTVLDPDGEPFPGEIEAGTWRSTATTLLPAATYRVTAAARDAAGEARPLTLAVKTTAATRVLHATLSPGDDAVVGVGQPVVVLLDHPVKDKADRAAVGARLQVTTVPAVQGAWRWMENNELHYRGPSYWAAGTRISVTADLTRLQLSGGTWGSGRRTSAYRIGDAMVSTVDVNAHTMTVRRNGKVLRVLKVSTGRPEYETHNGVHIVLSKTKLKTMDSSTIGIPRNGPGGYYLKVPNSVRISNSGEFVHSAPGTVRQQGRSNVSHGCVNLAPADAAWFYPLAKRGDVVEVKGSPRKPISWDPGTSDWNIPFSQWAS